LSGGVDLLAQSRRTAVHAVLVDAQHLAIQLNLLLILAPAEPLSGRSCILPLTRPRLRRAPPESVSLPSRDPEPSP
jgi:hypothetical protein